MNRFDGDTAVVRLADSDSDPASARPTGAVRSAVFEGRMDRGWWIQRGPNGGYVAAVLLRALTDCVGDPARHPRSLTVHYTAPPAEGPVRIETVLERAGRSLSTVSARMLQGDRVLALALAAFSAPREHLELHHARMPEVAPPESLPARPFSGDGPRPPMHGRYEQRWAIGEPPFSGAQEALSGGWIRCSEPRVADALLVAAVTDAWPPALFSTLQPESAIAAVPTVDLSVHFRVSLPLASARPDDWLLAVFRVREAREGFFEEDGEVWSRDGVLLAQSRQLGVLL